MRKKSCGGFTLIELALSLIFIAILSVTIVLLIQNVSASYRRGLILNQVNTVGMDLIDDFRISIQNATSDPVTRMCEMYYKKDDNPYSDRNNCINDNANSFISVTKYGKVKVDGVVIFEKIPVYGALCTGTYTYVWNSGYFESADSLPNNKNFRQVFYVGTEQIMPSAELKYNVSKLDEPKEYTNFRLLKVYDKERSVCVNKMKDQNENTDSIAYKKSSDYEENNQKITNIFLVEESRKKDDDVIELMTQYDAADLVLYDLYFSPPALSATRENSFYAASFILGTRRGGISIKEAGNNCKPPSDDYSELEYCAINKFNFAVMAGGK